MKERMKGKVEMGNRERMVDESGFMSILVRTKR